jgi:hypothetical protein|tara:strand:- start:11400 stop:11609 length:210 start_codon:yes stop_codon:yes gene_type:complete
MSTLADLMNPETRNILEKYKRLSTLALEMGIEKDKTTDLVYISDKLKNTDYKHKEEILNLIEKLSKIKK